MAYAALPTGFTADSIERIREFSDEPADSAKFSNPSLFRMMRDEFRLVMSDINNTSDRKIICRYALSVTAAQRTYLLPCSANRIMMIGKADEVTGDTYETLIQRGFYGRFGPGFTVEGNVLRLEPAWDTDETLYILYVPTGDCMIHTGTYGHNDTGSSSTGFRLAASPTEGYLDQRPTAYIGAMVRLLAAGTGNPSGYTYFPVQERIITNIVAATKLITVSPAFSPDPSATSNTYTYEVVPFLYEYLQSPVCIRVARKLVASGMLPDISKQIKFKQLSQLYLEEMRAARNELSNVNVRNGDTMSRDIPISLVGLMGQGD